MEKINDSYLEIKKSKFIGIMYRVDSVSDVDEILKIMPIDLLTKIPTKFRTIIYISIY